VPSKDEREIDTESKRGREILAIWPKAGPRRREKMANVKPAPVVALPTGTDRTRRVMQAIAARRRLGAPAPRGRAWINGREVGGPDPRWSHLGRSHD
jgi:hypothetical protein